MTFTEIVTAVQTRFNLTSSESATRIGFNVNDRYKRITSSIGIILPRYETTSALTSIGVSELTFTGAEQIYNVHDRSTTPYRILTETSVEQIRARQPSSRPFAREYAKLSSTASSITILLDCTPEEAFLLYADILADADTLSGSMEPAFHESFHDILVTGVIADEYRKQRETALAKDAELQYEFRLGQLRLHLAVSSSKKIYQSKSRGQQVTSVGGSGSGSSGGVGGSGTIGYLAKWQTSTALTDSKLYETPNSALFWQDTSNANNADGFTINQLSSDDHILTFKSSDIATGLTTAPAQDVETDDFGAFSKISATAGGLRIQSLYENTADPTTFQLVAWGGTASTTKSTSGRGLIELYGVQHDGANVIANTAADGNVFAVRTRVGGADTSLFILDEDGDTWQTGNVTAVNGVFSGAISGTTGTFSGAVSGTTGTFSGAISGTTGTFSSGVSGTSWTGSADVQAGVLSSFVWLGRSRVDSPLDSNITLFNNAKTAFNLLQFGGTSASFPAIRRNGAGLDIITASESAYSSLTCSSVNAITGGLSAGTTVSAGTTITAGTGLTITTGNLNVTVGGIVLGGGQIAFPATQNASADANTLDDYEEGHWTPTLTCTTSGTVTIASPTNAGYYVKVGKKVNFSCNVLVDSVSAPVGTLQMGGLPFTILNDSAATGGIGVLATGLAATATTAVAGHTVANSTLLNIYKFAAGSVSPMAGDVQAGTVFFVSGHYIATA